MLTCAASSLTYINFIMHTCSMLQPMFARKPSSLKLSLGGQIAILIVLKVMILTGIWYAFVRDHKVPHGTPETAQHLLS